MKLLMVTRDDDSYAPISGLTNPIIKRFAEKWGADLFNVDTDADSPTKLGKIHYRTMAIYDLLDEYDRVMSIDSDVIINKNCPNLFELVPEDIIGVTTEDKGSRLKDRRRRIQRVQAAWGDVKWRTGYINIGVFLVSRSHKEIFRKFKGQYWEDTGYTDVHFGYQIHRLGFKIFELHWHFNHTSIFSEPWNGSPSRFDSHIIHYAGHGAFPDKGKRSRVQLIRDDIKKIYGEDIE